MSDQDKPENDTQHPHGNKRRNLVLAIVLAAFALAMYASIFLRLSENPLSY
jgi:hypothetical protein